MSNKIEFEWSDEYGGYIQKGYGVDDFDPESKFDMVWRNGRAATNLWKYIPNRVIDGVADATVDSDGYWIYLESGWTSRDGGEDCRTIHAYSIKELKEDIKTIRKVAE